MRGYLIIFSLILLIFCGYTLYQYVSFQDGKLHVVFCHVGQGDAALIRTPKGKLLLIDGGPDQAVLGCLARHTPFWERTIAVMFLTHPHADHFIGLIDVLERYYTKQFGTEKLENSSEAYTAFTTLLQRENVPTTYLRTGDSFHIEEGMEFRVLAPTEKAIQITSPTGNITDNKEFTNLILHLRFGLVDVLFSGDSQEQEVAQAVKGSIEQNRVLLFHVPHHGSRFGLSKQLLDQLAPEAAVISVGKNSYGHPAPVTLQLLQEKQIPVYRTDRHGDVVFVIDGKTARYKH